jgi:hypothetical protein
MANAPYTNGIYVSQSERPDRRPMGNSRLAHPGAGATEGWSRTALEKPPICGRLSSTRIAGSKGAGETTTAQHALASNPAEDASTNGVRRSSLYYSDHLLRNGISTGSLSSLGLMDSDGRPFAEG